MERKVLRLRGERSSLSVRLGNAEDQLARHQSRDSRAALEISELRQTAEYFSGLGQVHINPAFSYASSVRPSSTSSSFSDAPSESDDNTRRLIAVSPASMRIVPYSNCRTIVQVSAERQCPLLPGSHSTALIPTHPQGTPTGSSSLSQNPKPSSPIFSHGEDMRCGYDGEGRHTWRVHANGSYRGYTCTRCSKCVKIYRDKENDCWSPYTTAERRALRVINDKYASGGHHVVVRSSR